MSSAKKVPEHQAIYERVKEMLVFGGVTPGQSLTIHGLADTFGAGITPVREAIRRLTAEGALNALQNRRIEVPEMTRKRLGQIRMVRLTIEPELALSGAKCLDKKEIMRIEAMDRQVDEAIESGDISSYLRSNYDFHFAIYSAADLPILERLAESLWLQTAPAQRVIVGRYGTANLLDRHAEVISALRVGDVNKVRWAIEEDIRQGLDLVEQELFQGSSEQDKAVV